MEKTIKAVSIAAAISASLLIGANIGVVYGLTAKPVLDMEKCVTVTRYEDNTLRCQVAKSLPQPRTQAPTTPLTVKKPNSQQGELQKTIDAHVLQPTVTGAQLQPAEQ